MPVPVPLEPVPVGVVGDVADELVAATDEDGGVVPVP